MGSILMEPPYHRPNGNLTIIDLSERAVNVITGYLDMIGLPRSEYCKVATFLSGHISRLFDEGLGEVSCNHLNYGSNPFITLMCSLSDCIDKELYLAFDERYSVGKYLRSLIIANGKENEFEESIKWFMKAALIMIISSCPHAMTIDSHGVCFQVVINNLRTAYVIIV